MDDGELVCYLSRDNCDMGSRHEAKLRLQLASYMLELQDEPLTRFEDLS
jgi:hypothetical protein